MGSIVGSYSPETLRNSITKLKMSGRGAGGKVKTAQKTKQARAGLQFPVGRILKYLKKGRYAERTAIGAAVYMTAVMEYLTAEVLQLAIRNDEELHKLLAGVTISQGGVLPNIQAVL